MKNPNFDINKLAVLSAILVLMGDFIALLAAYQTLLNEQNKISTEMNIFDRQRLGTQRISQRFR